MMVINKLGGVHQETTSFKKGLLLHPHTLISIQSRLKIKKSGKRKDRILSGCQATKEGRYEVVNNVHCMDGFCLYFLSLQ